MFTGLIEEIGQVAALRQVGHSLHLTVQAGKVRDGLALGDSVAVDGVCLTVVQLGSGTFTADAMPETYHRTTMRHYTKGTRVNLERCLQVGSRLGGHMVQGHVDGVGTVTGLEKDEIALWIAIAAPPEVQRYIVPKGSVAIDGISLTVAQRLDSGFRVGVIPHTAAVTTLGRRKVGDPVNLEGDIIGKYVEQFVAARFGNAPGAADGSGAGMGVTADLLLRSGLMKAP